MKNYTSHNYAIFDMLILDIIKTNTNDAFY